MKSIGIKDIGYMKDDAKRMDEIGYMNRMDDIGLYGLSGTNKVAGALSSCICAIYGTPKCIFCWFQ